MIIIMNGKRYLESIVCILNRVPPSERSKRESARAHLFLDKDTLLLLDAPLRIGGRVQLFPSIKANHLL